jgi:hypothetical protein
MFCAYCGMNLPASAKFCVECGRPVGAAVASSNLIVPRTLETIHEELRARIGRLISRDFSAVLLENRAPDEVIDEAYWGKSKAIDFNGEGPIVCTDSRLICLRLRGILKPALITRAYADPFISLSFSKDRLYIASVTGFAWVEIKLEKHSQDRLYLYLNSKGMRI